MAMTVAGLLVVAAGGVCGQPPATAAASANLSGSILVYCEGAVKDPVVAISQTFTAETRIAVDMTFADTAQLLGQIETAKKGDVFVPGDIGFAAKAQERKLIAGEPRPFCYVVPALCVRKGNPKGIQDVSDLARPGLKLALAGPGSALGRIQAELFATNRIDEAALRKNTVTNTVVAIDVLSVVSLGAADAGIVWESSGAAGEAELVRLPPGKNAIGTVSACVLARSKNPKAAKAFLDYLGSDKARGILQAKGFAVDPSAQR